jgi:hypothetical protein
MELYRPESPEALRVFQLIAAHAWFERLSILKGHTQRGEATRVVG